MSIDVKAGVIATTVITLIFFLISFITGVQAIIAGRRIKFFQLRRVQVMKGWRLVFLGLVWIVCGFAVYFLGEPIAYRYITPSQTPLNTQTPSLTPTITLSPTITQTPTITLTPAESYTPEPSSTPYIPVAVEARFEGRLTPPAEAAFSPLIFTNVGLDENYDPIGPGIQFTNPVGHLYAVFSYAQMLNDVQWTALWYRESALVHYESLPWNGGSGGIGYTDWDPAPELWIPGEYAIQIFLGKDFYISGFFSVVGDPPTPTITLTPVPVATATPTPTPDS